MAKERTFTFDNGLTVEINRLNPLQLQDIQMVGRPIRPKIPIEKLILKGGGVQERPNPNNADYLAAMEDFKLQNEDYDITQNYDLLRFVFLLGIKDDPPAEFVASIQDFVPDPKRQKYQWIASQMPDTAEITRLIQVITGQTVATEEGISESTEIFPADSETGGAGDAAAELPDAEEEANGVSPDAAADGGNAGGAGDGSAA